MIYTCPKCGKKMELSTEVLINSDYKVICPQCLCELHIVGDYAYIPSETLDLDTSVEPSHVVTCPRCGRETSSSNHFCPNCGAAFDEPQDVEPSPAVEDALEQQATVLPPPLPGSDPLYNEALKFLMQCTSITPMMLRDHFHISDERAAQLIRQLEQAGAVGPYNNGGPRQILIPHRELYGNPMPRRAMPGNAGPAQGQPTRPRVSCLTWLLLIIFFIFLMKACGA